MSMPFYCPPTYLPYLETLRLLPDDVVLDMGTREFEFCNARSCVCGWALRAALSTLNGKTPDEFDEMGAPEYMVDQFGGSEEEWTAIFYGVTPVLWADDHEGGKLPLIELAFVHRVAEAVR